MLLPRYAAKDLASVRGTAPCPWKAVLRRCKLCSFARSFDDSPPVHGPSFIRCRAPAVVHLHYNHIRSFTLVRVSLVHIYPVYIYTTRSVPVPCARSTVLRTCWVHAEHSIFLQTIFTAKAVATPAAMKHQHLSQTMNSHLPTTPPSSRNLCTLHGVHTHLKSISSACCGLRSVRCSGPSLG